MIYLKKLAKIKAKNLLLTSSCIILILLLIWLVSSPTPHLRSFVSNTQLHIKNINSKFEMLENVEGESIFNQKEDKNFNVDSTYLELLGFVKEPTLFDNTKELLINNNQLFLNEQKLTPRIPPLVTAFKRFGDKEKALIESKMQFFYDDLILIYDLDLSSSEQLKVCCLFLFGMNYLKSIMIGYTQKNKMGYF